MNDVCRSVWMWWDGLVGLLYMFHFLLSFCFLSFFSSSVDWIYPVYVGYAPFNVSRYISSC